MCIFLIFPPKTSNFYPPNRIPLHVATYFFPPQYTTSFFWNSCRMPAPKGDVRLLRIGRYPAKIQKGVSKRGSLGHKKGFPTAGDSGNEG